MTVSLVENVLGLYLMDEKELLLEYIIAIWCASSI